MLVVWKGILASFLVAFITNLLVGSWIKLLGILHLVLKGWFPVYVLKWEEVALDFLKSKLFSCSTADYIIVMQHELYFHFWFLSERQTWLYQSMHKGIGWQVMLVLGEEKVWGWVRGSQWTQRDSISNGGFGCGGKGVWIQEKGYYELIWVKLSHKLYILFKSLSTRSVNDTMETYGRRTWAGQTK